jgi:hypothetical protein
MKILFIYECDNGYQCRCCRQTWEEFEVFEYNKEDEELWSSVEEYVEDHKENIKKWYEYNDSGRYRIIGAYIIEKTLIEEED